MDLPCYFDTLSGKNMVVSTESCQKLFSELQKQGNNSKGISLSLFVDNLSGILFTDSTNPVVLADAFCFFDKDKDGLLNQKEFEKCFNIWIKPIISPKSGLIIVDVQYDFIDGSLALKNGPAREDGYEVIPLINQLLAEVKFDVVVYTQDWHPSDHCSFINNIKAQKLHPDSKISKEEAKVFDIVILDDDGSPVEQQLFPAHAVQNTHGADLHNDLAIDREKLFVKKGVNPHRDCLSGFIDVARKEKTKLDDILSERGITDVYVCGLAYDYCVGRTTLDALNFGYRTVLIEDVSRGLDREKQSDMRKQLEQKGVLFAQLQDVSGMVSGFIRPSRLGCQRLNDPCIKIATLPS